MHVLLMNGPNLDLLGRREPEVYGSATLADLEADLRSFAGKLGVTLDTFQSNHEGEIVDVLHEADHDGLLINPGALTHTSRAIADAILGVGIPTVEIHISNVREREPWRAVSVISPACVRTIYGRGFEGYRSGLRHLINRGAMPFETLRYGPHPENVGDLRRGERALIVLVHGGFWRHEWERDTIESLAVDLSRRGYSTWNIEYRRLGADGGWPGSAQDVATALEHARRIVGSDASVALIGHSAGGYLALWSAQRVSTPIGLVVGLAPITDLRAVADSGGIGAREAEALLDSGAPPAVGADHLRTLLVTADADSLVAADHARRITGSDVTHMTTDGGHFHLLDPAHDHWPLVRQEIESVLG